MLAKSVLLFGGLALLPACPLLDVQTEVPEVCVSYDNIAIDLPAGNGTFAPSFVVDDLGSLHDLTKLDASLAFVHARVRATSGLADMAFVTDASVAISSGDPDSTLPRLVVYACGADLACAPDGKVLDLEAPTQPDAVPYATSSSLIVDLSFTGKLPAAHAVLAADICMTGTAMYSYSP